MRAPVTRVKRGGSGRTRRAEPTTQRRAWRAHSHLERRRRRGQLLSVANPRAPLAVVRRFRRLRLAACSLCGLTAGLLADPASLQVGAARWRGEAPRIESISVSGHGRLAAQDVARATGVAKGSLLTDLDPAAVEARLTSHPWIRAARAAVLPDGELLVRIEERQPRAVIRSDSERLWHLVDDAGTPFALADPELAASLPKLRTSLESAVRQPHEALAQALAVIEELRRGALLHLSPAEAATSESAAGWPPGLELHLPEPDSDLGWVAHSTRPELEVILGDGDIEERLGRLEQLLDSRLPEVQTAGSIDLRFADRAVLRAESVSRRGGHQAVAEHGVVRPSKPGRAGDPPPRSLGGEKHGTKR